MARLSTSRRRRLAAFVASLLAAWLLSTRWPFGSDLRALELKTGYWVQFALLSAWAFCLLRVAAAEDLFLLRALRERIGLAVLALALVACWFAAAPPSLRILTDEANLAAVAQGFHERREPSMCMAGEFEGGRLACRQTALDKRSNLFPFLVSVAHRLLGYRLENVFVVNFALGALALVLTGLLAELAAGGAARLAAPVLLAAVPTLGQAYTSGGFEGLNLTLLLAVLFLWLRWHERPSRSLWALLVATHALLGYTRYEGFLYVLCGAPVLWSRRRSAEHQADVWSWWSALSPLAVLPLLLRWAMLGFDVNQTGAKAAFRWDFLASNSLGNLAFLFVPEPGVPGAPWLAWLGLAALVWLLWERRAARAAPAAAPLRTVAWSALAISAVLSWIVTASFLTGALRYPNSFRYSLPLFPPLALACAAALGAARLRWPELQTARWGRLGLALLLAAFAARLPSIRDLGTAGLLIMYRERMAVLDYLSQRKDHRPPLVVYPWSQGLIPSGINSWNLHYAAGNLEPLRARMSRQPVLLVWGLDCEERPAGDPFLTYDPPARVCRELAERFTLREVARPSFGGLWVLVYELSPKAFIPS